MARTRILRSRLVGAAAVAALAGALALVPAVSASAHDYLVKSDPKAGSTVSTALSKVVLTFDDRVLDLSGDGSSNVVEVLGADGRHFETGCVTIADTDVSTGVALGDSGTYKAIWQIVSADGHAVSNSLTFTYDRPQDARVAEGATARPECGAATDGASASAEPTSDGPVVAQPGVSSSATAAPGAASSPAASSSSGAAATGSDSSDLPVVLGVGGGVIVLALVAVLIVLTRARRSGPPAD